MYQLVDVAAAALEPGTPGPSPQQVELRRLKRRCEELEAQCQALQEQVTDLTQRMAGMVAVSTRQRDRLELVCFAHNVSVRGTQEIIEAAHGESWRPGSGSEHRRLRAAGQQALELLAQGRAQVADKLA